MMSVLRLAMYYESLWASSIDDTKESWK